MFNQSPSEKPPLHRILFSSKFSYSTGRPDITDEERAIRKFNYALAQSKVIYDRMNNDFPDKCVNLVNNSYLAHKEYLAISHVDTNNRLVLVNGANLNTKVKRTKLMGYYDIKETEARADVRKQLEQFGPDNLIYLQGMMGIGKSYTLADYTIRKRIQMNKNEVIIYLHLNARENRFIYETFYNEVIYSTYDFIIDNYDSVKNIFRVIGTDEEGMKKLCEYLLTIRNRNITIVIDQINEKDKGDYSHICQNLLKIIESIRPKIKLRIKQ